MAIPSEYPTLINGDIYSWSDIRFQFSNMTFPLVGVTAISYSDSRLKTNIMGVGDKPIGRSSGPVSYEASITLYKDELKRLQDAAPFGDITLLGSFEIPVTYISTTAGKITTDTLKNVEFTNNPTTASQGDESLTVELTLIIAGIKRGNNPFF